MNFVSPLRLGLLLTLALLVSCAGGRQVPMSYQPGNPANMTQVRVKTTVVDARPAVIAGDREPWVIGRYPAGVGYNREFVTPGRQPLANKLHLDLLKEIRALGMGNVRQTERAKQLDVRILNWDFDGTAENILRYRIKVTVTDESGRALTSGTITQNTPIDGTFFAGARGGYERVMPRLYPRIVASIIRENNAVRNALASRSGQ